MRALGIYSDICQVNTDSKLIIVFKHLRKIILIFFHRWFENI